MNNTTIFHLAIPINNIDKAKIFYCDKLDCTVGRETNKALIMNFYGHQVVAHITEEILKPQKGIYPRHFGLIFPIEGDWEALVNRVREKQLSFYLEPKSRFIGELTEHRTFFLEDPFYNLLEFKFYNHFEGIFGCRELAVIGDN